MILELSPNHRSYTKCAWNTKGITYKDKTTDDLYDYYIACEHCEICSVEFNNTKNKHLDHCHATGEFRQVLCRSCNLKFDRKPNRNSKTGYKHIGMYKNKYYVKIVRDGKYVINKKRSTLKEALKIRDDYITSTDKIYNPNFVHDPTQDINPIDAFEPLVQPQSNNNIDYQTFN